MINMRQDRLKERRKYMIHPSYTELIEAINTNSEDDDTTMSLNSRYSMYLLQVNVHARLSLVPNQW